MCLFLEKPEVLGGVYELVENNKSTNYICWFHSNSENTFSNLSPGDTEEFCETRTFCADEHEPSN